MLMSDVFIERGLIDDLFISFYPNSDNDILITVRIIPMMTTLWGGMILCLIGITIRTIPDIVFNMRKRSQEPPPASRERERGRRKEPQIERKTKRDRGKKDYESLFEEELKKRR